MEILQNKITNTVLWIKQGVDFNANYTIELKIVLPELYLTKKLMWSFHVDDSQGNHRYYVILVIDVLSGLKVELFLYNYNIRVN